ncbi:MAG: hypothetical protein ACP5XB_15040, partial [Isosphaeraceae bacterium]
MLTSANETLFPTLGPIYQRLCLGLARILRPVGRLFVGISLRRLMAFVLVLGVLLGWYVRSVRIQRAAVAAIEATGGSVFYDSQNRNEGPNFYYKPFGLKWLFSPRVLAPKWLVDRIGFDYTGAAVYARLGPKADDATMVQVGQLDRLESLGLSGTNVTDAGLVHLEGLTLLHDLRLDHTRITDAGLAHLKGLNELRTLDVANTHITDDGVLALQDALPWLQVLRDEDSALWSATSRAMNDLDFARSRPVRLACLLLAHRAEVEAHQGKKAELIATASALCELGASDKVSLAKVAIACTSCMHSLEFIHPTHMSAAEKKTL